MINTLEWTQAMRSNDHRMVLDATSNLYREVKTSPTTLRIGEMPRLPTAALNPRTKDYLRHLETKFLVAVGTIYGSLIVACIAAFNLLMFTSSGDYWFHPFISINLLVACVGLTIVAVAVIRTVRRYFREVVATS